MCANSVSAVSVVIISYNSKEFLRQSVGSALALDWPGLEVIVVDNSSSDGSPEMVEAEFGSQVRLIRREDNSPTAGRNEGFRAAHGEYILSLDDDMILDRTMIRQAVPAFKKFPRVAALVFKIGTIQNPHEPSLVHWWHPVPIDKGKDQFFITDYFGEGAVFFRKDAVLGVGGYDPALFRHFEGNDLSLRILSAGYDMLFCPNLCCGEMRVRSHKGQGTGAKVRPSLKYLGVRNRFWLAWKYYPFWRAAVYLMPRIPLAGFKAIRYGWMGDFCSGVWDGLFAPKAIRDQRRPFPDKVWNRISEIHRGIILPFETVAELMPSEGVPPGDRVEAVFNGQKR